jgi:hypothetical protein
VGPVLLQLIWHDYQADGFATDTTKFWVQLAATF